MVKTPTQARASWDCILEETGRAIPEGLTRARTRGPNGHSPNQHSLNR